MLRRNGCLGRILALVSSRGGGLLRHRLFFDVRRLNLCENFFELKAFASLLCFFKFLKCPCSSSDLVEVFVFEHFQFTRTEFCTAGFKNKISKLLVFETNHATEGSFDLGFHIGKNLKCLLAESDAVWICFPVSFWLLFFIHHY